MADKDAKDVLPEPNAHNDAGDPVDDFDRDSLHTLALSLIPFKSNSLRKARLIKNRRLETMIEVFQSESGGSGQMEPEGAAKEFGWDQGGSTSDLAILRKLAELPSYDVYSLRVSLRHLGIEVDDVTALKLSTAKQNELTKYMKSFTRPLILGIYGAEEMEIKDFHDVIKLFAHPDKEKAAEKLHVMAERLGIEMTELPAFLEDFGDIFLSLSYYRQALDRIEPIIRDVLASIRSIQRSQQLSADPVLMKNCRTSQAIISRLMISVSQRLDHFDRITEDMWKNINGERFRKVEALVRSYQTVIGGILCALSIKMEHWAKQFPSPKVGGPMRRAEFIMSEMRQGIENIQELEEKAPKLRRHA